MKKSLPVLMALLLGLALGALAEKSANDLLLRIVGWIQPLGTMWTNAIRMTVVPLVVSLVITGIAGGTDPQRIARMGKKLIPLFLGLLLAGGLLSIVISVPAMERLTIPELTASNLRAAANTDTGEAKPTMPTIAQRIVEVIPVNPIKAAADAAMLPLVFFAIVFALALLSIGTAGRKPIVDFFSAVGDVMMVVVKWVLVLAPVGVFALALGLGSVMGASAAGALLYYVVIMAVVLLTFTLLIYPAVRIFTGVPFQTFAAATGPAQGIALGSRSSLAALPAVIAGAREHLKAPESVTGFALPLAVSVFRVNVPMAWVVGVLFLAKLYGVELDIMQLITLVLLSSFISFSVPGIPSASLFLMAPVLINMGIPAEGAAILISVDAIPDMFKTAANVTSHSAVAAVMSRGADAAESEAQL